MLGYTQYDGADAKVIKNIFFSVFFQKTAVHTSTIVHSMQLGIEVYVCMYVCSLLTIVETIKYNSYNNSVLQKQHCEKYKEK